MKTNIRTLTCYKNEKCEQNSGYCGMSSTHSMCDFFSLFFFFLVVWTNCCVNQACRGNHLTSMFRRSALCSFDQLWPTVRKAGKTHRVFSRILSNSSAKLNRKGPTLVCIRRYFLRLLRTVERNTRQIFQDLSKWRKHRTWYLIWWHGIKSLPHFCMCGS